MNACIMNACMADVTEATECWRSPDAALAAFGEQIRKGEAMGVVQMYEDAARAAGCSVQLIERERVKARSALHSMTSQAREVRA
jgi:hypothetical protein